MAALFGSRVNGFALFSLGVDEHRQLHINCIHVSRIPTRKTPTVPPKLGMRYSTTGC